MIERLRIMHPLTDPLYNTLMEQNDTGCEFFYKWKDMTLSSSQGPFVHPLLNEPFAVEDLEDPIH